MSENGQARGSALFYVGVFLATATSVLLIGLLPPEVMPNDVEGVPVLAGLLGIAILSIGMTGIVWSAIGDLAQHQIVWISEYLRKRRTLIFLSGCSVVPLFLLLLLIIYAGFRVVELFFAIHGVVVLVFAILFVPAAAFFAGPIAVRLIAWGLRKQGVQGTTEEDRVNP